MPTFAPEWPRNDKGWIIFPQNDRAERLKLFPEEVMGHPAMLNIFLQQAIIEYVSREGDVLLDPFGGTGTLMLAALQDRKVILLDVEEHFHQLQQRCRVNIAYNQEIANNIILLHGDNRLLLPIPCNHIITSPPYAQAMNVQRVREEKEGADGFLSRQDKRMSDYSKDPRNVGRLNTFLYNQAMERVYKLCYQSLLPSGTLTIVIKDRIHEGEQVYISNWAVRVCLEAGFIIQDWFKRESRGTAFTNIRRYKGEETVDAEDIIILRRDK